MGTEAVSDVTEIVIDLVRAHRVTKQRSIRGHAKFLSDGNRCVCDVLLAHRTWEVCSDLVVGLDKLLLDNRSLFNFNLTRRNFYARRMLLDHFLL